MRQLKISKSITTRNETLDKYLQEISREPMITVNEEIELAQRIRQGDRAALEKLTRANLRFVVSVAKQYQNQGLSLSDLINEGNIGLLKAGETHYNFINHYNLFLSDNQHFASRRSHESHEGCIAKGSQLSALPSVYHPDG